jgi:hypothetical protein
MTIRKGKKDRKSDRYHKMKMIINLICNCENEYDQEKQGGRDLGRLLIDALLVKKAKQKCIPDQDLTILSARRN